MSMRRQRSPIGELVHKVATGAKGSKDLTLQEAIQAGKAILTGSATGWQAGALLGAMRVKGEAPEELAGFTLACREFCQQPPLSTINPLLEIGGAFDRSSSEFQASPVVMIVTASLGLSSVLLGDETPCLPGETGPKELLQALGIPPCQPPDRAVEILRRVGCSFWNIEAFCPPMATIAPYRRSLGIRTTFNTAEKLLDLSKASYHLVGVFHGPYLELVGRAVQLLGFSRCLVIQGPNGSEDLSPARVTKGLLVEGQELRPYQFHPEDFGLPRWTPADLTVGSPVEQGKRVEKILQGEPGPCTDMVLLNASLRLWLAGKVEDWREGVEQARKALKEGWAKERLELWRKLALSLKEEED